MELLVLGLIIFLAVISIVIILYFLLRHKEPEEEMSASRNDLDELKKNIASFEKKSRRYSAEAERRWLEKTCH